jgi:hypothetical protein
MKNITAILSITILSFFSTKILSQPVFEFRAVWVASVENIDWPSKKGLSVNAQTIQDEFW